jgi:hypothetical protein
MLAGVMVAAVVPAACGEKSRPDPTAAPASPPLASPATSGLPAGHPPVDGRGDAGNMGGAHGRAPVGEGGLSWTTPAGWVEEKPNSPMRRSQYRVPGPGGDGECVVFYFGAGEGGDPQANAERWAGQFTVDGGKPAQLKTSSLTAGGVKVMVVETSGTYHGGPTMGAAAAPGARSGYMLLGAIAEGPDANWFFKFTGPEATLRAQRAAFDAMLRSLKKARG